MALVLFQVLGPLLIKFTSMGEIRPTFGFLLIGTLVLFKLQLWRKLSDRIDLSAAYSVISLHFVVALPLSSALFSEKIFFSSIIGVVSICLGVYLMQQE